MNSVTSLRHLATLGVVLASSFAAAAESQVVPLTPKPLRKWGVILPEERFSPIGSGIVVAAGGQDLTLAEGEQGVRRSAVAEGERLRVDLDGDGKTEALVEGTTAFLTLACKSSSGADVSYSVRVRRLPAQPFEYSCGGAMAGVLDGTEIRLFDQDLNGSYADVGVDAMIVGKGNVASYLSRIVTIGAKMWSIEIAADGSSLSATPFLGDSGVLDLASGFVSKAKLAGAIVRSDDGEYSFELAAAKQGQRVPTGRYQLVTGRLALGEARATISTGRTVPFEVTKDAVVRPTWGGPVSAEFAAVRSGAELGFTPWDIWYYGALGEEYGGFMPLGESPDFTVTCRTTPEQILHVKLPGNC